MNTAMSTRPGTGRTIARLANELGATPPREFRIFKAGLNDTENGPFLFDRAAADATMDAYRKWGVDLMIDLEHQSLEDDASPDPTAKDARGWCQLELRPDGSLWATRVTWTPDGEQRLRERRQRYVSPAFGYDVATKRVTQIVNVAITAMPATHGTPALMAASRGTRSRVSFEELARASLTESQRRILATIPGATATGFLAARRAFAGRR